MDSGPAGAHLSCTSRIGPATTHHSLTAGPTTCGVRTFGRASAGGVHHQAVEPHRHITASQVHKFCLSMALEQASAGALEAMAVHSAKNLPRTLAAAEADGWLVLGEP